MLFGFVKLQAQIATFETTKGIFVCQLHGEKAPLTVANFINLVNRGFYDGMKFDRTLRKYLIQAGNPTGPDEGPGYYVPDEFHPELKHGIGALSMANDGPGRNGSQFFITFKRAPQWNRMHSVFGTLVEGIEIAQQITLDDKIIKITISGDIPQAVKDKKDQVDEWNKILDVKFPIRR